MPLSSRVTLALWALIVGGVAIGAWLFAVVVGEVACESRLCNLATLDGHPALAFGLAAAGTTALLTMAIRTKGLTQGSGIELLVVSVAALLALVSIIGALLVVAFAALVVALGFTVLIAALFEVGVIR